MPGSFRGATSGDSCGQLPVDEFFSDPLLLALVDEALENNRELKIAEQELVIAGTEIMARRGEYLPSVGIGASVGLEKVGRFTSQGASDESDEITPGRTVPEDLANYSIGFRRFLGS